MLRYVAIRNDIVLGYTILDDEDKDLEGGSLDPIGRFCVYDAKYNVKTNEYWMIFEKEKAILINHNGKPQRTKESIGITLDASPISPEDFYREIGIWELEEVTKAEFQNGVHLMGLPVLECTSKLMYVL